MRRLNVDLLGIGLWYGVHSDRSLAEHWAGSVAKDQWRISTEGENMLCLHMQIPDPEVPCESVEVLYWIDSAQGFTCVQSEMYLRQPDNRFTQPIESSRIYWTQIQDVWVPAYVSMHSWSPSLQQRSISGYELQFDWRSVNAALPMETFEPDDVSFASGTKIWDERSGTRVLVKTIE